MRKWGAFILYCIVGAVLYTLPTFCKRQTGGFSVMRITPQFPKDMIFPEMALNCEEQDELTRALDQPYEYLGRGGQSFVFASQDGHYVCKFFRTEFHPFGSLWWQTLPLFPEKKREKELTEARNKLERDFGSYWLASQELKKETAMLYVHLSPTTHLKKIVVIKDKLGISHPIDLDHFSFAVQRRAELAFSYIERRVQHQEFQKAHEAIRALIALNIERCKKGIHDQDAKVHKNFGFIDQHPLFIDLGRFVKDPSRKEARVYEKDISEIVLQIKEKFPLLFDNDTTAYD